MSIRHPYPPPTRSERCWVVEEGNRGALGPWRPETFDHTMKVPEGGRAAAHGMPSERGGHDGEDVEATLGEDQQLAPVAVWS